ncbi:MAG: glycosyltransferase [Phycisphaerales bacterium]
MTNRIPILIVSYYFPPCGGAGTQRFAKFAKFLPSFGYQPIIVTADTLTKSASAPTDDLSLLNEVGKDAIIYRVPNGAPARLSIWDRLRWRAGFRTDHEHWVAQARPTVFEAARAHRVQAVITTVSPYAVAALGPIVRRACDVPWLLDLRDPWALDGWRVYPSFLHARSDYSRMKMALHGADTVIANTPEARRAFIELIGVSADRACTIPNGFDPADFEDTASSQTSRRTARFRLVHVGTLHNPIKEQAVGWRAKMRMSLRRIDPTGRSGLYLFEALAALKHERPDLFAVLQVDLVGHVHHNHRPLARSLRIEGHLVEHGTLPHREALELMQCSDAVFVPLHGLSDGRRALIVPGKLYEAIASERYVLGCLPEGDAARLIRTSGCGAVCRPDDVTAVTRRLIELLSSWRDGRQPAGVRRSVLAPFTRQALTGQLATVLDALICGNRPVPLDDPWVELNRLSVFESSHL